MKFDKDKAKRYGIEAKSLDEAIERVKELSGVLYRHGKGMTCAQWFAVLDIYDLLQCITIKNGMED